MNDTDELPQSSKELVAFIEELKRDIKKTRSDLSISKGGNHFFEWWRENLPHPVTLLINTGISIIVMMIGYTIILSRLPSTGNMNTRLVEVSPVTTTESENAPTATPTEAPTATPTEIPTVTPTEVPIPTSLPFPLIETTAENVPVYANSNLSSEVSLQDFYGQQFLPEGTRLQLCEEPVGTNHIRVDEENGDCSKQWWISKTYYQFVSIKTTREVSVYADVSSEQLIQENDTLPAGTSLKICAVPLDQNRTQVVYENDSCNNLPMWIPRDSYEPIR